MSFALFVILSGCYGKESVSQDSANIQDIVEPSEPEAAEPEAAEPESVEPSGEPSTELPDGLTGTTPDKPLPAPEFSALHYDGSPRSQEDLIGQPSVLWFFPLANTPG